MSFRFPPPSLPTLTAGRYRKPLAAARHALLACALLAAAAPARAEDPFIGQIRAIKCVNCQPGWVTLIVHDPIEMREIELHVKDTDYYKIIAPLPGKRIYEGEGQCFYWMEKPKKPKEAGAPGTSDPGGPAGGKGKDKAGGAEAAAKGKAEADSSGARDGEEGSFVPPPTAEATGTPSKCIPFHRQSN